MARKLIYLQLVRFDYYQRLILAAALAFTVTAKSADVCSSLFERPAEIQELNQGPKEEIALLFSVFDVHFLKGEVEASKLVQEAVKKYVDIIDPLEIVIPESEYVHLSKMPKEVLDDLSKEVFASPSRKFFEELNERVAKRYQDLTNKFFTDGRFRKSILKQAEEISDESLKSEVPRALSTADMESKLVYQIARRIAFLRKVIKKEGREMSPMAALKIVTRQLRETKGTIDSSLEPKNISLVVAKAFVSALDPHSHLLLNSDVKRRKQSMEGSFGGLGFALGTDQNGFRVESLVSNGPLDRAGVQVGDVITHVSTSELRETPPKPTKKKRYWYSLSGKLTTSSYFRGPVGTEVNIRVLRNDQKLEFKVLRENIEAGKFGIDIEVVSTKKGNIAHVKFNSFFDDSSTQLRNAILDLKKTKALAGVVLDLRNNGGGRMHDMVRILGLFVESGPGYVGLEEQKKTIQQIPKDNQTAWDGPLVVLTNARSASASEALSGALQDYGRAVIVGDSQTYGKGTMQIDFPMEKVDALMPLTIGMFFTPSGRTPQVEGIASDIVLMTNKEEKPELEKDYSNVIPPIKLESLLPIGFSMIANRSKVIAELNRRSQERLSKMKQEDPVGKQNTQEALKILEDLISLAP